MNIYKGFYYIGNLFYTTQFFVYISINTTKSLYFKLIIIIKKDKGKIINQIYIDEDIEKINQQLLNEKFTINNSLVKLIPINDNNIENKDKDKNDIINEENEKLKNENELLKKKDIINADMIQKLDKEKENLIQEINKLIKENNEQKI